jgi:LacI family transcriptional regulator
VQHLASLGHRRIALSIGTMRYLYQHETLRGFKDAIREFGLDADDYLIVSAKTHPGKAGEEAFARLVQSEGRPTAIITSETSYSATMLQVLQMQGVKVPDDISLLGFELDGRFQSTQAITRIELPFAELGRAGATLLHEIASSPNASARRVMVTPSLVLASTCASPKAGSSKSQNLS